MPLRRLHCLAASVLLLVSFSSFAVAQEAPVATEQAAVIDRVNVPGPIRFAGEDYALVWSSNPEPTLFKQEYLPKGQQLESYTRMLMIDVRPDTAPAKQTIAQMARALEQRKATDPMTNYRILEEKDGSSLVLDFLISAKDAQGQIIVEWNAYRYEDTPDGKGSVMVGLSRRAYGDADARTFLTSLKQDRTRDIEALGGLDLPIRVGPSK